MPLNLGYPNNPNQKGFSLVSPTSKPSQVSTKPPSLPQNQFLPKFGQNLQSNLSFKGSENQNQNNQPQFSSTIGIGNQSFNVPSISDARNMLGLTPPPAAAAPRPITQPQPRPATYQDYLQTGITAPGGGPPIGSNNPLSFITGIPTNSNGYLNPNVGANQWTYQNGYWANTPQPGQPGSNYQAPKYDFAGNLLGPGGQVYTQDLGGQFTRASSNPSSPYFDIGGFVPGSALSELSQGFNPGNSNINPENALLENPIASAIIASIMSNSSGNPIGGYNPLAGFAQGFSPPQITDIVNQGGIGLQQFSDDLRANPIGSNFGNNADLGALLFKALQNRQRNF